MCLLFYFLSGRNQSPWEFSQFVWERSQGFFLVGLFSNLFLIKCYQHSKHGYYTWNNNYTTEISQVCTSIARYTIIYNTKYYLFVFCLVIISILVRKGRPTRCCNRKILRIHSHRQEHIHNHTKKTNKETLLKNQIIQKQEPGEGDEYGVICENSSSRFVIVRGLTYPCWSMVLREHNLFEAVSIQQAAPRREIVVIIHIPQGALNCLLTFFNISLLLSLLILL